MSPTGLSHTIEPIETLAAMRAGVGRLLVAPAMLLCCLQFINPCQDSLVGTYGEVSFGVDVSEQSSRWPGHLLPLKQLREPSDVQRGCLHGQVGGTFGVAFVRGVRGGERAANCLCVADRRRLAEVDPEGCLVGEGGVEEGHERDPDGYQLSGAAGQGTVL